MRHLIYLLVQVAFSILSVKLVNAVSSHLKDSIASPWPWLCAIFHDKELIISHEISLDKCRLSCTIFRQSNDDKSMFTSDVIVSEHNVNEGLDCGSPGHTCQSGVCKPSSRDNEEEKLLLQQPFTSKSNEHAIIHILNAKVPKKDVISDSDVYVLVQTETKEKRQTFGRTATIWNQNEPNFDKIIKIPVISRQSNLVLTLFDDENFDHSDFIAEVIFPFWTYQSHRKYNETFSGGWLRFDLFLVSAAL